ncbi:MAG: nucleotide exchange factor GrpE [Solirubrobacteraceae bacterium]|jgi:molecular chaperone GrpE
MGEHEAAAAEDSVLGTAAAQNAEPEQNGGREDAAGAALVEPDGEQGSDDPAAEEVEFDLEQLTSKAAERDEYLALAQRTQADFENYRKRMVRESAAAEARGTGRLARELLPALDNLERALASACAPAAPPTDDGEPPREPDVQLIEGLRLVQRELLSTLQRVGIERYGEPGERFDPAFHEAVAQQPFDGHDSGAIVEVYQAGYRLEATVIRPARVLVAA